MTQKGVAMTQKGVAMTQKGVAMNTATNTAGSAFSLRSFLPPVALLGLGVLLQTSAAACWTTVTPAGYNHGLEGPACVAWMANGCASYTHCPSGSNCKWSLVGGKNCTAGAAVVPAHVYTGGAPIAFGPNAGCCDGGVFLLAFSTTPCTVPTATLWGGSCVIANPGDPGGPQ